MSTMNILDNKEQDDFIKYNLSKLDLWNNFALEFSVRGGALKRITSETFYDLFALGVYWNNFDYNHFYWALKNGALILAQKETEDKILFSNLYQIINSDFVKLTYFIDNSWEKAKLKLCINSLNNCSINVELK